jgi:hypothetical protein
MRWEGLVARMGEGRGVWWGNLREIDHWGDPGVDGRIILKWIFREWDEGMDWIKLAQNSDSWWALVNAAMNLQVPYNAEYFWTS